MERTRLGVHGACKALPKGWWDHSPPAPLGYTQVGILPIGTCNMGIDALASCGGNEKFSSVTLMRRLSNWLARLTVNQIPKGRADSNSARRT